MPERIGIVGLGAMGRNLAANFHDHGIRVTAWERDPALRARAGGELDGIGLFDNLAELVDALPQPRRLLLMIASGAPVDSILSELRALVAGGDVIVDGGNSHYRDTARRCAELRDLGIGYLGLGISGGPVGARSGPSIMAGGPLAAWSSVTPVFEPIAARHAGTPCASLLGEGGAGHFVKMVHNGIEYAVMQIIAEIHELLMRAEQGDAERAATRIEGLRTGPADSFLMEITSRVAAAAAAGLDGFDITRVDDAAGQKGTGGWTVEAALELGVAVPTIAAAVMVRNLSASGGLRGAAQKAETAPAAVGPMPDGFADGMALAFASAFAQGFAVFTAAGDRFGAPLDRACIAATWMAGTILRGAVLTRLSEALRDDPARLDLLDGDGGFVAAGLAPLRQIVSTATGSGVPVPALASALAYVENLRQPTMSTRLIQLQRDHFGAHGLRDRATGETFHGPWHDDDDA